MPDHEAAYRAFAADDLAALNRIIGAVRQIASDDRPDWRARILDVLVQYDRARATALEVLALWTANAEADGA